MKKSSVRNTTWDELQVGASASIERSCSVQDLYLFAHVSGNLNPLMLSDESVSERVLPRRLSMRYADTVDLAFFIASAVLGAAVEMRTSHVAAVRH